LKVFLSTILLCLSTISSAQTDSSSIYYKALKYYCLHLDSIKSADNILFIEDLNGVFATEFNSVGKRNVIFLTTSNIKKIYKQYGKSIKHVTINPAQVVEDIIQIKFVPYFKVNPNSKIWERRKRAHSYRLITDSCSIQIEPSKKGI
jgi:hypothetical protein